MRFWFDCWHKKTTFPITLKNRKQADAASVTYVVCLECGRELQYDWKQMKVVKQAGHSSGTTAQNESSVAIASAPDVA